MDFLTLTFTNNVQLQEKNRDAANAFKENLSALSRELLIPLENFFERKLIVFSAFRCEELNAAVGGAKNSEHLQGTAADIVFEGLETQEAFAALRAANAVKYGQLILEKTASSVWLHISLPFPHRAKEVCGQSFILESGILKDFKSVNFYD